MTSIAACSVSGCSRKRAAIRRHSLRLVGLELHHSASDFSSDLDLPPRLALPAGGLLLPRGHQLVIYPPSRALSPPQDPRQYAPVNGRCASSLLLFTES